MLVVIRIKYFDVFVYDTEDLTCEVVDGVKAMNFYENNKELFLNGSFDEQLINTVIVDNKLIWNAVDDYRVLLWYEGVLYDCEVALYGVNYDFDYTYCYFVLRADGVPCLVTKDYFGIVERAINFRKMIGKKCSFESAKRAVLLV